MFLVGLKPFLDCLFPWQVFISKAFSSVSVVLLSQIRWCILIFAGLNAWLTYPTAVWMTQVHNCSTFIDVGLTDAVPMVLQNFMSMNETCQKWRIYFLPTKSINHVRGPLSTTSADIISIFTLISSGHRKKCVYLCLRGLGMGVNTDRYFRDTSVQSRHHRSSLWRMPVDVWSINFDYWRAFSILLQYF